MRIGNSLTINADIKAILDKLILQLRAEGSLLFMKGYKDSGEYVMVQCPYHKMGQEKHASAQFRKSDGLFYCHGCKESHSLISVINHCLDVNGRTWLLSNFDGSSEENREVKFDLPSTEKEEKRFVDKSVLTKYRFIHPYMYERKLTLDVIRKFDIGYDSDYVMLVEKEDGTVERRHIGECITFPAKDEKGNIVFIARRAIHQKFFHYPMNVDKPIYGLYEIYREMRRGVNIDEVYVCESMLDALVIWAWGKYAIALNGTGSKKQYEMIKRSGLRHLILATDNDNAGKTARQKFRENVTNKFIEEIDYASYGTCKDINDMTEQQFLTANIIQGGIFS